MTAQLQRLSIDDAGAIAAGILGVEPLPDFAVVVPMHGRHRASELTLTIRKDGFLGVSVAAYEGLGRPSHVELLYAAGARVIGLRASTEASPNSRSLKQQPGERSAALPIAGLLTDPALATIVRKRYEARWYGDVLGIQFALAEG